ncbi:MAG: hypothetical protein O2856_20515 [Planctomycetota bacterium]|nr:hypothetical protein [Planctomycetota bacterium]
MTAATLFALIRKLNAAGQYDFQTIAKILEARYSNLSRIPVNDDKVSTFTCRIRQCLDHTHCLNIIINGGVVVFWQDGLLRQQFSDDFGSPGKPRLQPTVSV